MASRIHNIHASTTFDWVINDFSKVNPEQGLFSEVFSVGGLEWQMQINQNCWGRAQEFFSVYLIPLDSTKFPLAFLAVSILNLLDHTESARRGFEHKFNRDSIDGFGMALMPLSELRDPGKGYIVHDTCVLRIELSYRTINIDVSQVMLESNVQKVMQSGEYSGEGKNHSNVYIGAEDKKELYGSATFDWVVNGFSKVNSKEGVYSNVFSVGDTKWKLHINPNAVYSEPNECLVVCLLPVDSTKDVFADFSVSVLNLLDYSTESERKGIKHKFDKDSVNGWGLPVMTLSELNEPGKGYIVSDTCVLKVVVSCRPIDDDVREDMIESNPKVMQSGEYPDAGFGQGQNNSEFGSGEDMQEFEDIGGLQLDGKMQEMCIR